MMCELRKRTVFGLMFCQEKLNSKKINYTRFFIRTSNFGAEEESCYYNFFFLLAI